MTTESQVFIKKMQNVDFFVIATVFEEFTLWEQYNTKIQWLDANSESVITIGFIDDDLNKPIMISLSFVTINNKNVCFYRTVSRYNDVNMVMCFINKFASKTVLYEKNFADATNFHICYNFCKNNYNNRNGDAVTKYLKLK